MAVTVFVVLTAIEVGISWLLLHDFVNRRVQLWWRAIIVLAFVPGSLVAWAIMHQRGQDPFADVLGMTTPGDGGAQQPDPQG